jgi:hypothetical protein
MSSRNAEEGYAARLERRGGAGEARSVRQEGTYSRETSARMAQILAKFTDVPVVLLLIAAFISSGLWAHGIPTRSSLGRSRLRWNWPSGETGRQAAAGVSGK